MIQQTETADLVEDVSPMTPEQPIWFYHAFTHVFMCVKESEEAGVKMALASGQWLEKEIKGEAPSPRYVMFW